MGIFDRFRETFRVLTNSYPTSAYQNRGRIAGQAGMAFNNKRDLFQGLGYKRDLGPDDYRDRYRRDALAARVVEAFPKATWAQDPVIVEDQDPETTTEFEELIVEFADRINLWEAMRRTDILAGLGRYSVMLIGAPGEFAEPLESLNLDDILYLTSWSERDVSINEFVDDTADPRFGLPKSYNFVRMSANSVTSPQTVHWTRVLHVADGVLDDQVYGQPRLEKVWNRFDDLEKITGGGSEAYWLLVNPGYQVNVDKDTEMDEDDWKDLQEEIDSFVHNFQRFVRTRGTEMNQLDAKVSDFEKQVESIITVIAGATEIPKRILVGSEAAHLASTQDRTNWHERVQDRQTNFAEPIMVRPFLNRLIELGALPDVEEYEVQWPVLQDLDSEQQASVADKLSKLNSQIGDTVVTAAEIRDRILRLPEIDEVEKEEDEFEDTPVIPEEQTLSQPEDQEPEPTIGRKFKNVDENADEEPWAVIHRAADSNRAAVSKAFQDAVRAARSSVTIAELRGMVRRQDREGLENATNLIMNNFNQKFTEEFPSALLNTLNAGGRSATAVAKTQGTLRVSEVVLSFNQNSPEAIKWAREHSAQLIKGVSDNTRQAIQNAIALGFEEQLTIGATAKSIKNVIGLTPRDAAFLMRSAEDLDRKQIGRLANKLLRLRANNIARTETIAASNRGQQEFWRQALDANLLAPENAFQEWIVTPDDRLCPICEPMEGQVRGLGAMFETGDGDLVSSPPAHPSCRCAVGLSLKTKEVEKAS